MAERGRRHLPRTPRFLKGIGRLVGVPVSEVRAYWSGERRSIKSGSTALVIGLAATIVAGVVLGSAEDELEAIPGLLALIPAAIGMRGSIFGALGSRLATGIHTGEFRRELRRHSYLGRQIEAATILSFASATQAGLLAWLISIALGLPTVPLLDLVAISLIGGLLSSLVLFFVTIGMSLRSHHRGWTMDDVGAPIITATGDLVTLPALLLATLVLRSPAAATTIGVVGLITFVAGLWIGWRSDHPTIRRVVRESSVVLTIAVTIDVFAGVLVESRAQQQFGAAALLILLPPFIANCGSLGGMLSSRLASKLHVGQLQPRMFPSKIAVLDFTVTALLSIMAFTGVGLAGWVAAHLVPGLDAMPLITTISIPLLAGLFATPILATTAYVAAVASFHFGFDPDNHGIPIVTATMDLAGVICLLAAITIVMGTP
ncbi:MAG: magnesium transporter [Nitriliruptoraceae bacterium]